MIQMYVTNKTKPYTGWWYTYPSEKKKKNMKVTWDDDIPNRWKNKKCSKPQTSIYIYVIVKLLCH